MARGARILVAAAAIGAGVGHHARPAADASSLLRERFAAGRATATRVWRPCVSADTGGEDVVPRLSCGVPLAAGGDGFRRLAQRTTSVLASTRSDTSRDAQYTRALVELRWAPVGSDALDRAVTQLERVRTARPDDAAVLNDLAVAYLQLAERDQSLLPMLRALDALERALRIDGTLTSARFNRALVMERLYLVASARREWERYAASERDADWAREGRAHARALGRLLASGGAGRVTPHLTTAAGIGLLGGWGQAVVNGDSAAARAALARVGGALDADGETADPVARRALATIAAARSRRHVRALAAAHAALAAGYEDYARGWYERALRSLARAREALTTLDSPLAGWATLYLGSATLSLGRYGEADHHLLSLVRDSLPDDPALASKARLVLGVSQVRRGNYERANALYRDALPYLRRVRDLESVGYGAYLRAEGFARAGQARASQDEGLRAVRLLAPLRRSSYLNNQLVETAEVARTAGLPWAALRVMDEVLDVAAATEKPELMAVALCRHARDLYDLGRRAEAEADLRTAIAWADRMPAGRGHDRIRAAVQFARGELTRRRDPHAALPLLREAVETYRGFETDPYLPFALHEAARAARGTGDHALARSWLHEAVAASERMQRASGGAGDRVLFMDRVERIADDAIAQALDDGRADEAFAYVERAHAAVWAGRDLAGESVRAPGAIGRVLPADMLVAAYVVLDDRLVVWGITHDSVRVHVARVPRTAVAALVARLPEALRSGASPSSDRGALVQLHDLLLAPLAAELSHARRLIVVPDRELHSVPFPALWDRRAGRYVVEVVEVGTAPSAAFVAATLARPRAGRGGTALVVGDPRLGAAETERLGRLPGAAREAARVAALHGGALLLVDDGASRGRVVARLPDASVLHFAGHAVFDQREPDRSYLALAGEEDGRLLAREIGRLRLSRTTLVVLSACSTLNPRPTRAGAAAGLAYSFLAAGVPATISTLWDVNDAATTDLMVDLHRRLAAGREPSGALRDAQLDALRSPDPTLRAPHTWAAFTYTGT